MKEMERVRITKSRSTSGIEGLKQSFQLKSPSRLSADSYSCTDGSKGGDEVIIFDMERRPTMKKLLAEEMSTQSEPKKRAPGVIAKLMGVEALPSPINVHRQQKCSDICQQKNTAQPSSLVLDCRSRRSSIDYQEFKDVYEDMEASHVIDPRCSSRWNASSILTTPDMMHIQRKLLDAEQLVSDEMLQDSDGMDDTSEMREFNQFATPKFHKQPDSFVMKYGPQVKSCNGSPITVLTPLSSERYENNGKIWRSEKHNFDKVLSIPSLTRKDGLLLEHHNPRRAYLSRSFPKSLLEEDDEENMFLKRMAVIKPKQGRIRFSGASCSLAHSPHQYQCKYHLPRECRSSRGAQKGSQTRKFQSHKIGLPRPVSREAMEIAARIAMRMREGWDEYVDANSNAFGGYIGDESSNESDSGSDLELSHSPRRKSLSETDFCGFPFSSGESSVNREAKRQLSDRWKMIQKYQGLEMIRNGSTLAEMLTLSDRESTPTYSTSKTCLRRVNNHCYKVAVKNDAPLGISSRDGWKGDVSPRSSRSRSLCAPSDSSGKLLYADELAENQNQRSCGVQRGRKKVRKGNLNNKEEYHLPNVSSSCDEKPQYYQKLSAEEANASFKVQPDVASPEVSGEPSGSKVSVDEANEVKLVPSPGSIIFSSRSPDISTKPSSDVSKNSVAQEAPVLRNSPAEPESSESSKEADHPSPVSVLEAPFHGDKSAQERIEKPNGELHEVRKQLHLLKMDSGTNNETTLLPNDQEETTNSVSENIISLSTECWQNSYAVDLLIRSPLEDSDLGTNWQYPLDPKLFEDLEVKYNIGMMGSKSERKLLFDRLNSVLLEILEDHVDPFPWVMQKLRGLVSKWEKEAVADAINRLINQDFTQWDESERELDKEMHWSDVRGEIDHVGIEIESLLIDEVITECCLVC